MVASASVPATTGADTPPVCSAADDSNLRFIQICFTGFCGPDACSVAFLLQASVRAQGELHFWSTRMPLSWSL